MKRSKTVDDMDLSDLVVVFCLYETALSGYGVRTRLRDWRLTEYHAMSPATIYRCLTRLQEQGHLASREVRNGNYPASRVFRITASGRRHYRRLMKEICTFKGDAPPLFPLIGLGSFLPRRERVALARAWMKAATAERDLLQRRLADHSAGATYGKPFAEWLLLDHRASRLQADLDWIKKYIDLMTSGRA
ncbi:MAG TPA: PadR family transcriptional regulator [Kiritimatiellia bacterium]|nr:PadR family transcriptional regulator [Kiritimatiellia bacterium]